MELPSVLIVVVVIRLQVCKKGELKQVSLKFIGIPITKYFAQSRKL